MIGAHAFSILQVGAGVLLMVGSGLVLHVLRLSDVESDVRTAQPTTPPPPLAVEEALRRAA